MSGHDTNSDINNLQEALQQQQQQISALREMVRKTDGTHGTGNSATTEKVRNITKKLNQLKAKAKGAQYSDDVSSLSTESQDAEIKSAVDQSFAPLPVLQQETLSIPSATLSSGSEKVLLLRQQMEQNKLRLAQRASSKLHLEQLVSELKEKMDTTQQCLDDTTELGKSMTDLSGYATLPRSTMHTNTAASASVHSRENRHRSAQDLTSQQGFNLEKERIKFLENRCRLLEKQLEKEKQTETKTKTNEQLKRNKELENRILELEQLLQERQNEIDIKTSENEVLSEEIRERISSDHDSFGESKENEIEELRSENKNLKSRITELENINDVLETTRLDLTTLNTEYKEKLDQLTEKLKDTEETLENLRTQLNEAEKETEKNALENNSNVDFINEDTEERIKLEMAKQIQELQEIIQEMKAENKQLKENISEREKLESDDEEITEKIKKLEATIESQREDLTERQSALSKLEEELMEKTIELNVLNANFRVLEEKMQALSKSKSKPLFSTANADESSENNVDLELENQQLKQKLDESNKAMIKLKLKCKQTEKQMEKLKKSSKLHEELIELQSKNEELQQRITELEDEKGQWQLMQVETDSKDSECTKDVTDEPEKADSTEKETIKQQTETINLLQQQKYEHEKQLVTLREELESLHKQTQNQDRVVIARVETQLSEIQLEEQLEQQKQEIVSLQQEHEINVHDNNELQHQIEDLQLEKQSLEKKLEHYINENMELLDKVEKLSKSSSSAESIEIVDRLTQQEHAEMAELTKRIDLQQSQDHNAQHPMSVDELTQTEMGYELSESLAKLREESSELMNKVAMFTTERREVLEKMEQLKAENQAFQEHIKVLTAEKEEIEQKMVANEDNTNKLELELQSLTKEKELLSSQVAESTAQKAQLSRELTSMQKSSEIVAALDNNEGCVTLFEKCEKSLSKLDTELEAYKRANDKNAKFNASKKLAKEAKNAHTQLSELLEKVKEASTAVETVTVVETVVAVTASNGKALAEYEQLTAQNRELKSKVYELRTKLSELEDASVHETICDLVEVKPSLVEAPKEADNQLSGETQNKLKQYEAECLDLKTLVDELRCQLSAVNIASEEKSGEITRLSNELSELRKISDEFDKLISDKETTYELQVEKFTCLRNELEGKCELYEGEMEILQTLVSEQKQQLIEAYKEHEHEMNLKMLDLQQRDEQILKLRTELAELRQTSRAAGEEISDNLEKECEKLRESLRINKALTAEQINELSNKQDTIDMLNQQLIDLYKTMEENTNKVIEKEDEIADMESTIASNNIEMERLRKDNEAQKSVVDKLLNELHSYQQNKQQISQLENEVQTLTHSKIDLENTNKELEKRSKEQLEKMKKFAANLKKRTVQCQELEAKLKAVETKSNENELQQELNTNVVLLNEHISDLELKIKTQDSHIHEIQEALQAKTIEILESMENNDKLENDLKEIRHELLQRDECIVQLKNALAASQEQTNTVSDWGDSAFGDSQVEELNEQLAKAQTSLLEAREILLTKEQALSELREDINKRSQVEVQLQQQIQQLQTELNEFKNKVEVSEATIAPNEQLKKLEADLSAKSLKFEKSKTIIKERNHQIQRLQAQLKELQEKLVAQPEELPFEVERVHATELMATPKQTQSPSVPKTEFDALKSAYDTLNSKYAHEKATFEQTIERLETLHDGIQAKLQEDMSYIESLEQENARYKEKICKLEECVGTFEERRASMERRACVLDEQMQSRADEYVKAEDELIYRLNMLSEHDDVIAQRLLQCQESKDELQDRLDKLQQKYAELSTQNSKLEKEYKNFKEHNQSQQDSEVQTLRQQLQNNETELQRLRAQYDAKLAAKTTEIDELENDLSEQLARINAEKRSLQEDLEKSRDNCTALKDEIVRLNESLNAVEQAKQESDRELTWLRMQRDNSEQDQFELQELRMQSMQDKTEIDNLRQQIETLATNHNVELGLLKTQSLKEIDALTSSHQAKMDELRLQSVQDKTDLENLRHQFESLTLNHQTELDSCRLQSMQDKTELENLRQQFESLTLNHQTELDSLRMQSMQDKTEFENLRQQFESMTLNHQAETEALRRQIAELDSLRMQVGQNQTDDQVFIETENKRLSDLLLEKESIIAEYQRQNLQLQMAAAAAAASVNLPPTNRNAQQPPDLFASLGAEGAVSEISIGNQNLAQDLLEKTNLITMLQRELESLRDANSELQRQVYEKNQELENINARSVGSGVSNAMMHSNPNEIIPAPPMFFASTQMAPSPFDDIVQRRYDQPILNASPAVFRTDLVAEHPTIEDLQRNVSDLEKYNQELEHKLSVRNNTEEELRHHLHQSEVEVVLLTEQHVTLNKQLQEMELNRRTLQSQLESRIGTLEEVIKTKDAELLSAETKLVQTPQLEARVAELESLLQKNEEQLRAAGSESVEAQMSDWHISELEQRIPDLERMVVARDAEIGELKKELEAERKLSSVPKDLEAQILPSSANVGPSLNMFFGNNSSGASNVFEDIIIPPVIPEVSQSEPVVEEVIVPKKAYICFPKGEADNIPPNSASSANFGFGDEIWGVGDIGDDAHWGGKEAAAEEKHSAQNQTSTSLLTIEQQLELNLQSSEERIQQLEKTLQEGEAQKQKLQEKLAKTMKVISKYKAQNEELKKKEHSEHGSGGGFFDDLDVAIQDELKNQVTKLESALEDQRKLQKEESLEKEKLLKRIDMLTAGNDRMAEMKERQDMDMEMYKTRIKELQQKLNQLDDWSTEGEVKNENQHHTSGEGVVAPVQSFAINTNVQELEMRIKSLKAEVEDLNGDKQELQLLLDEEKANALMADQVTKTQLEQIQKLDELNSELLETQNKLHVEIQELKNQLTTASEEHEKLKQANRNLVEKLKATENEQSSHEAAEVVELKRKLEQSCSEEENLRQNCFDLTQQLNNEEQSKFLLQSQVQELRSQVADLQSEQEKQKHISSSLVSESPKDENLHDELTVQLQEKESEIVHLKHRVEDLMREDQTEKLVLEILTKNQEIHMLKMQVKHLEDDKLELEHNLTLQITKEMQEKKMQTAADNEVSKQEVEKAQKLEIVIAELQNEKRQMEEELNVLNAHVMSSLELEDKMKQAALDLDLKNIEIQELRQTLESMKSNASSTSATDSQIDVTALNARWEALVEQRCSEIAQMWRTHLEQRENEFKTIEQRLKTEIESLQKSVTTPQTIVPASLPQRSASMDTSAAGSAASTPVTASSSSASADSSSGEVSKDGTPLHIINEAEADEIITKMQTALENQEMEIVSLKEQLAIRSAEYARLAAQYDPFKLQSSSSSTSMSLEQKRPSLQRGSDNATTLVPKSELDLALYMLHQRDMRCEEMTMELVALLEERDTLQLKLSNTLRQVETIKSQANIVEPPTSSAELSTSTIAGNVSATLATESPTKTMTTSSADDSADELNQKLSQLQTVNHSKDKIIKEDRDRRIRQMERIQQDVAKIPTAAVSELIGSDISRTSQTPSSALLNWLWGNKPLSGDSGDAETN